jgi:transcriptional regulator with GAF, ATPase, and Fis domain
MTKTVMVVSSDAVLQESLRLSLTAMRWQVLMATGGADAMMKMDQQSFEALLLDHWLPDLEVEEFAEKMVTQHPEMDVLCFEGKEILGCAKSPGRNELLHALRECKCMSSIDVLSEGQRAPMQGPLHSLAVGSEPDGVATQTSGYPQIRQPEPTRKAETLSMSSRPNLAIENMVGAGEAMHELVEMILLVASHKTTVLIEGETGTGKEIVARAVHRLSARAEKPLVILNCAAIPDALLEAELFGHTRGAFTGAMQSRIGRIEAAHEGSLFLDEIGEMPMALQAKILRFLECGELQRVGDNEIRCVDVRVIAATHQNLEKRVSEGTFRLDLFHRLAVFPIEIPPLRDRVEDIPDLCIHFLSLLERDAPRKEMTPGALEKLLMHNWPGNVRELAHVMERASILSGNSTNIQTEHIRLRQTQRP